MGLEEIVAKRRDSCYRSGRCRDWVKAKNLAHAAIERAMLIALGKGQRNSNEKQSPAWSGDDLPHRKEWLK